MFFQEQASSTAPTAVDGATLWNTLMPFAAGMCRSRKFLTRPAKDKSRGGQLDAYEVSCDWKSSKPGKISSSSQDSQDSQDRCTLRVCCVFEYTERPSSCTDNIAAFKPTESSIASCEDWARDNPAAASSLVRTLGQVVMDEDGNGMVLKGVDPKAPALLSEILEGRTLKEEVSRSGYKDWSANWGESCVTVRVNREVKSPRQRRYFQLLIDCGETVDSSAASSKSLTEVSDAVTEPEPEPEPEPDSESFVKRDRFTSVRHTLLRLCKRQ